MPIDTRLTCTQIAKRLGVDRRTVARWCESGRLASSKEDGRWRVEESALVVFTPPAKGAHLRGKKRLKTSEYARALAIIRASFENSSPA